MFETPVNPDMLQVARDAIDPVKQLEKRVVNLERELERALAKRNEDQAALQALREDNLRKGTELRQTDKLLRIIADIAGKDDY